MMNQVLYDERVVSTGSTTAQKNLRKSVGSSSSLVSMNSTTRSQIADAMLEAGKRLYTWKAIAEKYNALY